jgi:ParB family chromosome partitioning protein
MKIKISDINVEERVRVDVGDLSPLVESMDRLGLINPITVTGKNQLIAGYRRLQAAKRLGWEYIECTVVNPASKMEMLRIEADENITRKDFTGREMERYEEMRRYLAARGLYRLLLWLKRLFKKLAEFLKRILGRR